jgi:hypothetical protein
MLADALVEHRLPRHQLETDAVIDHGETAARELGVEPTSVPLTYSPDLAAVNVRPRSAAMALADTSHLRTLQIGDKILGHTDTAVLQPDGVAHVCEALPAAFHCLNDLPAEPGIGKRGTAGRGPVPGRAKSRRHGRSGCRGRQETGC